jgi:hypothetical protein
MKKTLLLAAMAIMGLTANAQDVKKKSNAQYLSIGPVAGVGMNWVSGLPGSGKGLLSTNFGLGLIYAKNEHWGWGGQLMVSAEGYDFTYNGNEFKAMPLYLRMPLRAYYFFGDAKKTVRPKVYLGPSLAVKLSENDNMPARNSDNFINRNSGEFNPFDLGINAGGGVNIKMARSIWLNLDVAYTQGLLDAVNDQAGNYNTNMNFGFGAGLLFGL